ncbi:FAD-dependent thymidylate synthase [Candidatus Eisenbacteria bacterium]|uniref:Flavin-dependent thymidylate synthase n=1 Tax=Eiseniibacteriota bacterium TaxID=2212470 RepID=A0ABV6YQQ2_UNCEI
MEVELLAVTPDAERVIEEAGRTCYMSQERASDAGRPKFIRMLVSRGHLSVLEHAIATFRIKGMSRAATHQIVRHRLCSFSQRSQRYVKEAGQRPVMPPSIEGNAEAAACFSEAMAYAQAAYDSLLKLGVPKEDARFVMPNATPSEIVISANFRELRHIIAVRGSRVAQWEVRMMAACILEKMRAIAPNVFFDFDLDGDGCVVGASPDGKVETR